MKIIWAVNVPVLSQQINWDATEKKRKELGESKTPSDFWGIIVREPFIDHRVFSFELCESCGSQVVGGRAKRKLRSCSKECNQKIGSAWAQHTLTMEREQKGKRPVFFWQTIRHECFKRDDFKCRTCGCDIRPQMESGKHPPEAHHIIPISKGGSNKLENLKTLCYDCHKDEHSRIGNMKRIHKCLEVD